VNQFLVLRQIRGADKGDEMNFKLGEIIGKKIVAIKDFRTFDTDISRQDPHKVLSMKAVSPVKPGYILFDDGETYLTLCEQDEYDYHDCNPDARILYLHKNKKDWEQVMKDPAHYPDSDTDI
jgi:hypothetical protein